MGYFQPSMGFFGVSVWWRAILGNLAFQVMGPGRPLIALPVNLGCLGLDLPSVPGREWAALRAVAVRGSTVTSRR